MFVFWEDTLDVGWHDETLVRPRGAAVEPCSSLLPLHLAPMPPSERPTTYYPYFDWLRIALATIVMLGHDNLIAWTLRPTWRYKSSLH